MTLDRVVESDVVVQTECGERYESLGYDKSGGSQSIPAIITRRAQTLRALLEWGDV